MESYEKISYKMRPDCFWTWLPDISHKRLWASCLPGCGAATKMNTISLIGKDSLCPGPIVDSMSVENLAGKSVYSRDPGFQSCLHFGGVNVTFRVPDAAGIESFSFMSIQTKVKHFIPGNHKSSSMTLRCISGPNLRYAICTISGITCFHCTSERAA